MLQTQIIMKNYYSLKSDQERFMPMADKAGRLNSICLKRTGSGGDQLPVCHYKRMPG